MSSSEKNICRRAFVAGATAAAAAAACHNPLAQADDTSESVSVPGGYIDDHIHLSHPWYGREHGPITVTKLLKWMDANNIAKACILPLVSPEGFWFPITTDFVLRETKGHRDRLLPFCDIDPRRLNTHLTTKKMVVDMLRRYIDAGAVGCGEHKCELPVDDPLNMRFYEACSDVGLPILFHLDNHSMMDKPGLPGLEKVLKTFPQLNVIGHAKGWWASISGGLTQSDLHTATPTTPVQPGGALDRLMEKYPNLYGDLSSGGADALYRDPPFALKFLQRRADRLLWGTDWYSLSQQKFGQFDLFKRFKLPQETVIKIASGNARRLFKLS